MLRGVHHDQRHLGSPDLHDRRYRPEVPSSARVARLGGPGPPQDGDGGRRSEVVADDTIGVPLSSGTSVGVERFRVSPRKNAGLPNRMRIMATTPTTAATKAMRNTPPTSECGGNGRCHEVKLCAWMLS